MIVQVGSQFPQTSRGLWKGLGRLTGQLVHQGREVLDHFRLLVQQVSLRVQQAGGHPAIAFIPGGVCDNCGGNILPARRLEQCRCVAQACQPVGIDIQHQVGPGLVVDGIAGVHPVRVHQYQVPGIDVVLVMTVAKRALTLGDGAQGPMRMAVWCIADLTAVIDLAQLHMGHTRIAPEQGFVWICHGLVIPERLVIHRGPDA
ncbi:hypothetical protein GCM10007160_43290 [Litchfieldella qijiaojingensis]|uniref:Uncharacterized protein n=1 Tax=Litchfieldella qijiaojingensis TaxID=980347 RepID=A0ABQ2ZG09_9GAMM|nr:hypothetical protein GCM10007160_43290 [Halomonas qijiaojingensis]